MTTHALAGIIARAQHDGTVTSGPLNDLIRSWLGSRTDRDTRLAVGRLRRLVWIAEALDERQEASDGS